MNRDIASKFRAERVADVMQEVRKNKHDGSALSIDGLAARCAFNFHFVVSGVKKRAPCEYRTDTITVRIAYIRR